MLALHPLPGHVLVELRDKYTVVKTADEKYDTRSNGICQMCTLAVSMPPEDSVFYRSLEDKLVFWEEYKTGEIITRDGKDYAFIKTEDLTGYEDEQSE